MMTTLFEYLISLAIGLLIGIERERSHPEGMQAMGARTFILLAILGTLAAQIDKLSLTIVISVFVLGAILLGYLKSTRKRIKHLDIGLTTEVSAAIVYFLGYMVPTSPLLAALIAAFILLVLLEKERLHTFSRKKLHAYEIEAAVALLIFVIGVIPFLPNRTIDPWQLFNPRFWGILIAAIAFMQFSGYVMIRIFGHRFGLPLLGFFGGLISSTAVFLTLPKYFHEHPKYLRSCVAAAIFSIVGTLIELIVVLLIASAKLLTVFFWPIAIIIIVGCVMGFLLIMKQKKSTEQFIIPENPLDIKSLLRLSLFIGSTLILLGLAKHFLGNTSIVWITFLGGLFELHGVSLANVSLYLNKQINFISALLNLAVAVLASFVSKFFILWTLARDRFASWTSISLIILLLVGAITFSLRMLYV